MKKRNCNKVASYVRHLMKVDLESSFERELCKVAGGGREGGEIITFLRSQP